MPWMENPYSLEQLNKFMNIEALEKKWPNVVTFEEIIDLSDKNVCKKIFKQISAKIKEVNKAKEKAEKKLQE